MTSYAVEQKKYEKIYSFYNVTNGEDLDGKSFLILGDYIYPHTARTLEDGNPDFSPFLSTEDSMREEYYRVTSKSSFLCTDMICSPEEDERGVEWTFKKNDDGTYSLYRTGSNPDSPEYLCSRGNSIDLFITDEGVTKFIVEYQNDGKIALKYSEYESFSHVKGPGALKLTPDGSSEDQYVVYNDENDWFETGSINQNNHVLQLYRVKEEAYIYYNVAGNTSEFGSKSEFGNYPKMDSIFQFLDGNKQEELYKVSNENKNDAYEVFKSTDIPYLSDLYEKKTADNESFKDPSPKSSKIWGREIVLGGWMAQDINEAPVLIDANASVKYDTSTNTIVSVDVNGDEVHLPNGTVLYAYYILRSENVFFDIKYTELVLNDGSLVTENVNTESLAVGHVYYPTKINFSQAFRGPSKVPGETYEQILKLVRNFTESYDPSNSNMQIVVEGLMEIDPTTMARVSYTPATGKSLSDITDHTVDYIFKYSDELNVQDIENVNDYDIVWYGTSTQPIGVIASGVMRDVKNFLVIDAAFEDISVNEIPVEDFKIEILNEDGDVLKTLTLKDNNVEVSSDKKRYTWKLNDMTENTYTIKQYNRNVGAYTSNTNATTDVDTNVGNLTEDGDVVVLKVSTVNNRKDQVRLVNKYEGKQEEKPQEGGNAPAPAAQPSGGAPASSGPVAQAVQSIYNGLLPKTGSASAFIITVIGFVAIVLAIRLRNTKSKKKSKK